jgi:shikimate kinase
MMELPNSIFLVGPMGAGKSTVGRLLAQDIGYDFKDSDQEIEYRTGANISWIFDMEGEEGFRLREKNIINELCQLDRIVLATGGGAVEDKANRACLAAQGTVIYLQASVEQQVERTKKSKNRPLLQKDDRDQVLVELNKRRHPLYQSIADFTLITSGKRPWHVVSDIKNCFNDADR